MAVERLGLCDNLMFAGSVPPAERYASLAFFERCVERAAADLGR